MIAASEPQEFIPSGRQLVSRHPGLSKTPSREDNGVDDLVLHRLKHVSLTEENSTEWWIVRESEQYCYSNDTILQKKTDEGYSHSDKKFDSDKSFMHSNECNSNDSWSWRTIDPNVHVKTSSRVSDINSSKTPVNKSRFSSDNEFCKNESKSSFNTNKSHSSATNPVSFKTNKLKCKKDNAIEEELYVKGNTAVWSRGMISSNPRKHYGMSRITLCSYTMENPIKHALWCKFYLEKPSFPNLNESIHNKPDEPSGKVLPSVCLVDACNMRVFTANEDFVIGLEFQVLGVWNTKFGILIEKDMSSLNQSFHKLSNHSEFESSSASLFSLAHPLDDLCPVAFKHSNSLIFNNPSYKIIYTCDNPSICLVYDTNVGLHYVYRLRRIKVDEWIEMSVSKIKLCSTAGPSPASMSSKMKHNLSVWSGQGAGLPLATGSPYSSRATSLSNLVSPHNSRSHSPMATMSRQSPISVSPFVTGGGWVNRSSYLHMEEINTTQANVTTEPKPVDPELCLDHAWTEHLHTVKNNFVANSGAASKAFLTSDLVGQSYLCYLVPVRMQLILVRMDLSNDNNLIFGTSYSLSAKDAVAIPNLHMIAVLEQNGHIMLHSGPTVIGKVHVGGVSAEFTSSPYTSQYLPTTFKSPFPRRSSLLPHCGTPTAVPRFDEHLISPVYPALPLRERWGANLLHSTLLNEPGASGDSSHSNITALRDSVADRITLQYSDNSYYRISLPAIATSSLVESCLNVLRESLQRDIVVTLFSKWYAMRNAPGPSDMTTEQEWQIFACLIFSLLGYDIEKLKSMKADNYLNAEEAKRQRPSPQGPQDWQQILQSDYQKNISEGLANLLHIAKTPSSSHTITICEKGQINVNSILFPYFRLVLFSLHLLYEELKLNTLRLCELPLLANFLHQLALDLRLENYVVHYWKDYPDLCSLQFQEELSQVSELDLSKVNALPVMSTEPVNIMKYFCDLLCEVEVQPYPYIKHVNPCSKNMLQLCAIIAAGRFEKNSEICMETIIKVVVPPGTRVEPIQTPRSSDSYRRWSWAEKVVILMTEMGITRRHLDKIPAALNLILHGALWQCRENPPTDWTSDAYYLLERPDLAVQAINSIQNKGEEKKKLIGSEATNSQLNIPDVLPTMKQYDQENDDGMEDVDSTLLKLRFPDDRRVTEIRRLLQSSEPVNITVTQRPDVTDHDFVEELERHLYAICTRTMALPIGRGMFTMRTATPVVTEPLPVPKLCLTGRSPSRGGSVELAHIDTPPNMNMWPSFHNGVAAGLRISPDASNIDSTWIVFNKPKTTAETPMEHAGFLMALGLNGHLKNLTVLNMYEYLLKFNELTSVGLLLGMAAAKRGTMETVITKMLSIHTEALLPPTPMELDIPQNVQVASLLGLGLVYQGSAHRHIAEVLLAEIGRPPGPDMENSVDRESYSLAAGLALGLVTLKQGGIPSGFADLGVPDMLHYYMVGGNKRPLIGSQKDKYKVPSFQIREGSTVNLDVTAPGATLALGLMYLGTGNRAIADWMRPPDTQYLLDFVRPDFLMLRIISRALILWDDIKTSIDWVDQQVPEAIRPFCLVKPSTDVDLDIDYESMNQAYCNIVAGACFAMGLRYAGSADENAFQTLYYYCRMFTSLTGKSIAELAGKPTIETCLNLILLSLGMVMAGTGRLEVIRICRHLRTRVGIASSSVVTYGSHLATHMTLGLLFLGGGRYTLSNSPASVAAMLCAFFPKFPTHSNDNRYHLQAFRHLYVLGVECRVVVARDVLSSGGGGGSGGGSGGLCYARVCVQQLDTHSSVQVLSPAALPPLCGLARVAVQDARYWPVVFERGRNWEQLIMLLESNGYVEVKQRAGCLSYLEDPIGSRSLLARALTQDNNIPWAPEPNAISSFSSEPIVKYFIDHLLTPTPGVECSPEEQTLRQKLTMAMYECVIKDKLAVLPMWIYFIKAIQCLNSTPNAYQLWQLKLLFSEVLSDPKRKSLISSDIALSMKQEAAKMFDSWESNLCSALQHYVQGAKINKSVVDQRKLACYTTFFEIPYNISVNIDHNYLQIFADLQSRNLSSVSINKVIHILSTET